MQNIVRNFSFKYIRDKYTYFEISVIIFFKISFSHLEEMLIFMKLIYDLKLFLLIKKNS